MTATIERATGAGIDAAAHRARPGVPQSAGPSVGRDMRRSGEMFERIKRSVAGGESSYARLRAGI